MGLLKKVVRSVSQAIKEPKSLIAIASGPVGMIAAGAKALAPQSTVSDLIATMTPTSVPLIENEKIKMAAITGYSVAAIAGGGIAAAHAYGAVGGVVGSAGGAKGIEAGLNSKSVSSFLASPDYGTAEYLPDDFVPAAGSGFEEGYSNGGVDNSPSPSSSGLTAADIIKGGAAMLSGVLPSKKAVAKGAGTNAVEAGMFNENPTTMLYFLIGSAVIYLLFKKVVK